MGVATMNVIKSFLTREKKKVVNEMCHHQHSHVRYYSKNMEDDSIEFWAHPMSSETWDMDVVTHVPADKSIYLGKFEDEKLRKCANFYDLSLMTQRGANKMWEMMGIYK